MTYEECWMERDNEVRIFIETNHRNPSKYYDGERQEARFLKQSRELMNAGEMQSGRVDAYTQ